MNEQTSTKKTFRQGKTHNSTTITDNLPQDWKIQHKCSGTSRAPFTTDRNGLINPFMKYNTPVVEFLKIH